ncbi:hypothetical protein EV359DRAFT_62723 [Lentinula novae-zelandiae]|nr:hypothetical protein EV359DRAFT_62723 [Lentinula novae-zelandiae]
MDNSYDSKKAGWEDGVDIRKFEEPSCWHMTQSDANGIFEVILHMQGVIEDKKLPPICGELTKKRMQHLRQSITVSGLGSKDFAGDVDAMYDMIFTPKIEAPNMNPTTVNPEMDENGLIARMNATDVMFIYGEENIVLYGEERMDSSGCKNMVAFGRGNELKVRLLLHNITLLDATHTQMTKKKPVYE